MYVHTSLLNIMPTKKYFIKKESQIMMATLKNNKFYKKKGENFNIYDRNILQDRKS